MDKKQQNQIAGVFSYVKDKKQIAFSVALAVISVFSGLLPYVAAARLTVLFITGGVSMRGIALWGSLAVIGYWMKTVCYTFSSGCSHKMAYSIMAEIRAMLADKLTRLSLGTAAEKTAGEYKQIIMDEIEHLEYPLAHMLPELTSHILGFLAVVIFLFAVSWQLALAAFGTLVLGFVIYGMMMAGKDVMGMFEKYTKDSEMLAGEMVEYVSGMEVIKAFGRTASSMQKFSDAVLIFCGSMKAWFAHCYPFLAGFYVVVPDTLLFVLPIGILLMSVGIVSLEDFILCMFLALGIAEPVVKIMEFADHIMAIQTTMSRIDELMGKEELPQGTLPLTNADTITMKDVHFGYGATEVLHGIDFKVHKGQKVAFVGVSGSGKSTIARLLVRFHDPDSGSIQVGGTDVRNVSICSLMEKIGFVTQDNFLFDISILENIRIGNPDATDEQVMQAAKRAGCHEFITKLPDGYDTKVGNAGGRLSGGQRQRIAIARMILKDAPVVILDEATAFIDPENEDKVQRSIESLTEGKTLIMIAHRLNTVIRCDCIYVVDAGKIVASGTHDELLGKCGLYRNLWAHMQEV